MSAPTPRIILGDSQAIKTLLNMIGKVASNKTNVLIIGESGTGKELVARMIHESGPLKGKPFVPVNCGAIPESLIESEMFGHKKGSFTGAISDKVGLFEAATGGTLFLDEVGELPLSMQVKLLRSLQERVIRRVGSNEDMKVDVRIIAATNRDLEAGISNGSFREDLYYRLNVIQIKTPPLRERVGDIELLALSFLKKFNDKQRKILTGFSEETMTALLNHSWPGNVRELENVIERAVTLEMHEEIQLHSLPPAVTDAIKLMANRHLQKPTVGASSPAPSAGAASALDVELSGLRLPRADFTKGPLNLDDIIAEVEKFYLLKALSHSGGIKKKAAEILGITFRSIRYRLNKLGIEKDDSATKD